LVVDPVASRLAHGDGLSDWSAISVDPPEPAGIPSCGWYRRWYWRSFIKLLPVRSSARHRYGELEADKRYHVGLNIMRQGRCSWSTGGWLGAG
jgi:hypothetical protein